MIVQLNQTSLLKQQGFGVDLCRFISENVDPTTVV